MEGGALKLQIQCVILMILMIAGTVPVSHCALDTPSRIILATEFIESQYVASVGLVRECPFAFPNRIWLVKDNIFASFVLNWTHPDLSKNILSRIREKFGGEIDNGNLGVLLDKRVLPDIPIGVNNSGRFLRSIDGFDIYTEKPANPMNDFADYADLLGFVCISRYNAGDMENATRYYNQLSSKWDGHGIADTVYDNKTKLYSTYKAAIFLYVTNLLNVTCSFKTDVEYAIWRTQELSNASQYGGIHTEYTIENVTGDTNIETTAWVIAAFSLPESAPRPSPPIPEVTLMAEVAIVGMTATGMYLHTHRKRRLGRDIGDLTEKTHFARARP